MMKQYTKEEVFEKVSQKLRNDKSYLTRVIESYNGVTIEEKWVMWYLNVNMANSYHGQELRAFISKAIKKDTEFLLYNVYEHDEAEKYWYIDENEFD